MSTVGFEPTTVGGCKPPALTRLSYAPLEITMRESTQTIINLRKQNKTYKEISNITKLSKSNVSYICKKHIPDNSIYIKSTDSKLTKGSKKAQDYYRNLRVERSEYWMKKLRAIDKCFLSYIFGLYVGEGRKGCTEFALSNSDKSVISDFIKFIRLLNADYSTSLTLRPSHDKTLCLSFWNITFDKVYTSDNRKQKKSNSNKYKENYGTVNVRVKSPLMLRESVYSIGRSYL